MDIYSEVQSSDPADLINSPFGGRYCGPNLPRRRISLYRAIALSFFTNKNATTGELFAGRYSFINACKLIISVEIRFASFVLYFPIQMFYCERVFHAHHSNFRKIF